jgi:hypothetical protein
MARKSMAPWSLLLFTTVVIADQAPPKIDYKEPFEMKDATSIFVGQGTGTAVGIQVGAMKAILEKHPELVKQMALTGDSGASIIAAYFACHGISETTLKDCEDLVKKFDPSLVNENIPVKMAKIIAFVFSATSAVITTPASELKTKLEALSTFKHENLLPTVNQITEGCEFRHPIGILASNQKVLENLENRLPFSKIKGKSIDEYNTVRNSDGKILGKACTYFVTKVLFDTFIKIPWEKRKCDLRLIRNVQDLRDAILASCSEPTYFPAFKEKEPKMIVGHNYPNSSYDDQYYNGGFSGAGGFYDDFLNMPETAKTPAIGTGRPDYTAVEELFTKTFYMVGINQVARKTTALLRKHGIQPEMSNETYNRIIMPVPRDKVADKMKTQISEGYKSTVAALSKFSALVTRDPKWKDTNDTTQSPVDASVHAPPGTE